MIIMRTLINTATLGHMTQRCLISFIGQKLSNEKTRNPWIRHVFSQIMENIENLNETIHVICLKNTFMNFGGKNAVFWAWVINQIFLTKISLMVLD